MKKIILPLLFVVLFISACATIETQNQNSPEEPQITEDKNCADLGQVGPNGSLGPNDPNQDVECCSGLILKSPKRAFTDECYSGEGFGTICIACGDGICDSTYESNCNCPEDCE